MRIHVIIFHNIETNPEVIKHLIGVNWKRFSISVLKSCLRTLQTRPVTQFSLSLSPNLGQHLQPFLFALAGFVANVKTQTNSIHTENILTRDRQLGLVSYQFCFEGRHINIESLTLNCEPWSITIKLMQETRDSKSSFLERGFTLSPKKVIFCIHHE